MTKKKPVYVITPAAERQLENVSKWWRKNRRSARVSVLVGHRRRIKALLENPESGELYEDANQPGVRRVHIDPSMPYEIYYTFDEVKNELHVRLVWSQERPNPPI